MKLSQSFDEDCVKIWGGGCKVSDGIPKLRFGLLSYHLQFNHYPLAELVSSRQQQVIKTRPEKAIFTGGVGFKSSMAVNCSVGWGGDIGVGVPPKKLPDKANARELLPFRF